MCLFCLHGCGGYRGQSHWWGDVLLPISRKEGTEQRPELWDSEADLKNVSQSRGRGKDGEPLEWSCDVPKLQKTKLEHSVGKNTKGRLIFKEIHTEPHSPTNYSKNSIPREKQSYLLASHTYKGLQQFSSLGTESNQALQCLTTGCTSSYAFLMDRVRGNSALVFFIDASTSHFKLEWLIFKGKWRRLSQHWRCSLEAENRRVLTTGKSYTSRFV